MRKVLLYILKLGQDKSLRYLTEKEKTISHLLSTKHAKYDQGKPGNISIHGRKLGHGFNIKSKTKILKNELQGSTLRHVRPTESTK